MVVDRRVLVQLDVSKHLREHVGFIEKNSELCLIVTSLTEFEVIDTFKTDFSWFKTQLESLTMS